MDTRIIVIGAGIAGLACASRLGQHGFKNVVILEARSRIGGRIYTHYSDDKAIEIGAQYIHGQINNPIYTLAEQLSLFETHKCTHNYEVSGPHIFNLPKKFEKGTEEVCQLFSDAEDNICEMYSKLVGNLNSLHANSKFCDKSCGSILLEKFNNYLEKETDPEQILMKKAVFDWHMRYSIESNASEPMTTISALYYGKYEEFEGFPYTEIQGGYQAILKELQKQILFSDLKLNSSVTKIDWRDSIIKVETAEFQTYQADHTVVTFPLGVLKAYHDKLFLPNLPKEKINAIECIGFGTVNKLFLKFDPPFWKNDDILRYNSGELEISYNVIWMDGLNYQGHCHNDGYSQTIPSEELEHAWFRYIVRFSSVLGVDDVLCAWIVGEGAKYSEKVPETVIVKKCHEILSQQCKRPDIPIPKLIWKSQWHNDSFSKGSYSFLTPSCDKDQITHNNLASPIYDDSDSKHPKILFAGEATHDNMFSTTHGALLSGYREADRIYDIYTAEKVVS